MAYKIVITCEDTALSSFFSPFILKEKVCISPPQINTSGSYTIYLLHSQGGCRVTAGLHIHTRTLLNWGSLSPSMLQNLR